MLNQQLSNLMFQLSAQQNQPPPPPPPLPIPPLIPSKPKKKKKKKPKPPQVDISKILDEKLKEIEVNPFLLGIDSFQI